MRSAYYNGEYTDFEKIRIPLSDRSIFFGDGVYDAAIGHSGGIYLEKEHIKRLLDNAARLAIKTTLTHSDISEILREVAQRCPHGSYFLYFQLSRTANTRAHAYSNDCGSSFFAYAEPMPILRHSLRLITTEDKRYRFCNIKTVNLLPSVIASKEAADAGCDEAVFVRDGIVTECAHSNIFIVKCGELITHPESDVILPGITRRRIINLCRELQIPCKLRPFTKDELYSADEIIVTSTSKLCLPASEIDGKRVGRGKYPLSKLLKHTILREFLETNY